jgi:hypothetical protein
MRTGDRPNFTPSSAAGFLATVMTSTKPSSGPIASSPSTTDQGIHVLIQSAGGHPDAISSTEVKEVVEWLAEPGLSFEASKGMRVPPPVEPLRPLLRLLQTGRYVMTVYVPSRPFHVVNHLAAHWYDIEELALVPTGTWPPVDHATVRRYQTQIESGGLRPAIVELSPSTDCGIGYVLDGHHKLAAYQQLGLSPLLLRLAPQRPFWPRQEEIDRATDIFAAAAWSVESERRDVRRLIATLARSTQGVDHSRHPA